jgi:predicted MPP superfamily phosphohydrolase
MIIRMIIFIAIVSAIYFGMHFFVYKSLTHSLVLNTAHQNALKWFFWLSGVSFLASQLLTRILKVHFLSHYAYTWLGVIAIAFFFFLLQRLGAWIFPSKARLLSIITVVIIVSISLASLVIGLLSPRVKQIVIPVKNLPKELSGFTIVQLSDLHLESYKSRAVIVDIVDKIIALKPDMVVITGDLLDGGAGGEPLFCEQLKRLNPPHGVFAITGNHEYYSRMKPFLDMAKCANIKVLINQSVTLAGGLQLVGLDDDEGRGFQDRGPDLEQAMKGCDPSKPTILLYHRPVRFDEAVAKGVDLQLSGHTHAGQIPPMDLIVCLYYKYPVGLYEKDGSYIYTSPGTGYWGPSMRLFSRTEITHITLESAQ